METSGEDSDHYTRTQKVSYQIFLQEQKVKLKSRYPFLTKDQINKKAKDVWNHMKEEEKQQYTKTVLTKTPTKHKLSSKSPNTKSRKKPESAKKWEKFREFEIEGDGLYENDFVLQSPSNLSNSLDGSNNELNWLHVETATGPKDFKNFSKTRCLVNHKVPDVVHNTPHTPQGILKGFKTDTSADKRGQSRVSFSAENDQKDIEIDLASYENSTQDSSDDEYSSKLIRRDDEVYDFDEIEQFDMNIEGENSKNEQNVNILDKENRQKSDSTPTQVSGDDNNVSGKDVSEKKTTLKPCNSAKKACNEPRENSNLFSYGDENSDIQSCTDIQNGKENTFFKSPTSKAKRTKNTKATSQKKRKVEALQSPVTKSMKTRSQQATPVTDMKEEAEKYTTPLMDEEIHQKLLQDVKKAPKKKSVHTEPNVKHSITFSPRNTQATKKKVRTSLIGENKPSEQEYKDDLMGPTGDAKISGDKILGKLDDNVEIENKNSFKKIRPYCKENTKERNMELGKKSRKESTIKSRTESYLLKESSPFIEDGYLETLDVDSNSDDTDEMSEELLKDSKKCKQALVKALLRMKQAVAGAPSPGGISVGSSPKLLSPALSGISQLSDVSSGSSDFITTISPIKPKMSPVKPKPATDVSQFQPAYTTSSPQHSPKMAYIPQNAEDDGILCQMFKESKTVDVLKTFYPNQRLISSRKSQASNFTKMFTDEDLFL